MESKFEELYNSAAGILSINEYEDGYKDNNPNEIEMTAVQLFEEELKELENNPDFTFIGHFDSTQDADDELTQQGLTMDQITKMSMNRYGDVIETLQAPDSETYWVFMGAK